MEIKLGPCLCGQPEKLLEGKDGTPFILRCPLYQSFPICDKDGKVKEEWKCSIAWMPILQIENRTATDGVAAYLESFRNELVVRIDAAARLRGPRPGMKVVEAEEHSGET